jgi:hypothetical protein
MPRLPLATFLVAALLASACAMRAASAQALFNDLSAAAKRIAESGDLSVLPTPAPILSGLTHTAGLVASASQSTEAWPDESRLHDAYAAALAYKSALATPLGAALDAIASRAAPELQPTPAPELAAAAASDAVMPVAGAETTLTADDGAGTATTAEREALPAESIATAEFESTPGPVLVASASDPTVAEIAGATSSLEGVAADDLASQAASSAPVAQAQPIDVALDNIDAAAAAATVAPEAIASAPEDPTVAPQAAPERAEATAIAADTPATGPVAAAESIQVAAAEMTPTPSIPPEIERIMEDGEAPAAVAGLPTEAVASEPEDPLVVAAVDAAAVETLENAEGETIIARTVDPNPARARPRIPRSVASSSPSKARPQRAEADGASDSTAAPAPAAPIVRKSVEVRRPPRGLFQFD